MHILFINTSINLTRPIPIFRTADQTPPAVTVMLAVGSPSTGPSLLTDQALAVVEGVFHEGRGGLVRGGRAAECRALHGDEHEGDGSGKDESVLHVVALGKFKFNSNSKVK